MRFATVHFIGGATYISRGMRCNMGGGYPVCCSGERACAIAIKGNGTYQEDRVTCKRCLNIMGRRVTPGKIGEWMGIKQPTKKGEP